MKKSIFVTGFAAVMVFAASAQTTQRDEPPKPPKPPLEKMKDVPPPPPPTEPLPPDPPPPPPAPPAPDGPLQSTVDIDAFMKRNPSVHSLGWKNEEVIIGLKSGKTERYNLNDAASKKVVEAKYGELPQAPPPPPPPPAPPAPPKPPKKRATLL